MITTFQEMLIADLSGPNSYGQPLLGWRNQTEFFRNAGAPVQPGPLAAELAGTFVEAVYILLRTTRVLRVYRGFETAGLKAPFGIDHPSLIHGLIARRNPGKPDGLWWTPARPAMAIDDMKLADMHRSEHRDSSAIKLEWNRIDYYIESELPAGALVYVGRAAPQYESALYGGRKYGGGGYQFRLTLPPERSFSWMKRYVAS